MTQQPPPRPADAHHASSAERRAASLGITVGALERAARARDAASARLRDQMRDPSLSGAAKHALQCAHVLRAGRSAHVCARCWTFTAVCMCVELDAARRQHRQERRAEEEAEDGRCGASEDDDSGRSDDDDDGLDGIDGIDGVADSGEDVVADADADACLRRRRARRRRTTAALPSLVVWCHHNEWARTSNTGVVVARAMDGAELLMKGLPSHDARFAGAV
jgi:hypothetical protein